MSDLSRLMSVKMRASRRGEHVSGAERIVPAAQVPATVAALSSRALAHSKGEPDFISVKVEEPGGILELDALPVATETVRTAEEGMATAASLLARAGFGRVGEIMSLFREAGPMRGAMLVDADTLERLEPDRERGVRATRMDAAGSDAASASGKNHFAEAVVLATKVANAPGIIGEICVSDDPDYVTGYVATKEIGYRRITVMKEAGDPFGGRIFLYRGPRDQVADAIRFLEKQSVVVRNVPPRPPDAAPPPDRFASIDADLSAIASAGLSRSCRVMRSPAGPVAEIGEGAGRREVVVLSSNDYLDLARDARVTDAAAAASRLWGAGSGGSRLTTGTQPPHAALERRLASFAGTEATVLYATGYMANVGVLTALAGKGDAIFSDALNHASIIDGCRLSGAEVVVYRHADLDDLADKLARAGVRARRRIVVSDGVFSMDGDALDLPRFLAICRDADAFSVVDEAHSFGVVGASGRGLREKFGCAAPDVTVGTLSKALGSEGGFAAVSRRLADYLVNKSRPFIFSTAPGAGAVAAADAALGVLEAEPERVARLRDRTRFFTAQLASHGIRVDTDSAIVPIPVGDERRAVEASRRLLDAGFLVPAIRYPTVAKGAARLRAAVMCAHSEAQLATAACAIAAALAT